MNSDRIWMQVFDEDEYIIRLLIADASVALTPHLILFNQCSLGILPVKTPTTPIHFKIKCLFLRAITSLIYVIKVSHPLSKSHL